MSDPQPADDPIALGNVPHQRVKQERFFVVEGHHPEIFGVPDP